MYGQQEFSDTELLHVSAATALPLSCPSSPVQHLTKKFSTAQLYSSPNTVTTTAVAGPFYTSGLHIPVKLPPFDPKQPKQWFQQADTIFWWSQVVSSQDKWDYTLPKLPTDILNNISDVVDSLTDATPNPYELAKNRLLETYTPTLAACSAALDISPCSWCVFRHAGESAVVTVAAWGLTGHYVPRPPPGQQ